MTSPSTRPRPSRSRQGIGESFRLAGQALRLWPGRQVLVAIVAAVVIAVVIGVATVLIPNPVFGREIPPVWWNYPVWLVTSALSGMLVATYIRPPRPALHTRASAGDEGGIGAGSTASTDADDEVQARRSSRMGMAGGILAWFAVGCPVCNKLALLALGYSGAITWFAPIQPFLALGALILTGVALVWRLRGQVACPVRPEPVAAAS
ncbi:hypothetical protein [Streptomyces sp. PT12]|uniref:hypothetical protein n=1 Tax=Streptomyces sp. PT12 TaxID=1510197 RepID=UPI000DE24996|nr:hypothetical protein [Streptomyces sp. PT12]RBM22745.1 hypothetical protein DEH69_03905 [Streptomyces sp. PT12]